LIDAPDGWVFVQADLSQAEMRVAAILAQDAELISCYRRGIDVHWRTLLSVIAAGAAGMYLDPTFKTAAVLNDRKRPRSLTEALEFLARAGHEKCIEIWKPWKEARKRAKAVNFGYLFGMRPPKFIETCKLKYGFEPTMDEAERSRSTYFHLYQQLEPWHKKQRRLVHLNGYVRNLAGRMRRLPEVGYGQDTMMPEGAEILSIQVQRNRIVCWAVVEQGRMATVLRRIIAIPTGASFDPDVLSKFLGTVQLVDGLVFHFFDLGPRE
jgi:DNA polymerase-1